jgi:hypothetical protein
MKWRASALALTVLILGAAERDQDAIKRQIAALKESDTSAWRKIPWTESLLAARRASEKENKPIFLFTHDGNLETGRC